MSTTVTISVRILDTEYQVRCAEVEAEDLAESARLLDERMRSLREDRAYALDRLAVVVALNVVRDNLQLRRRLDKADRGLDKLVTRVDNAIEHIDATTTEAAALRERPLP